MKNKSLKVLTLCALTTVSAACGGGGGGGNDSAFYGGIWNFTGLKVIDECNSGVSQAIAVQLTVNQNDNQVVVNSGTITLTGTTNPAEDGFTVTATSAASNGCQNGYAYVFKNASDGLADVGTAIKVICGTRSCAVAYGGTATRNGGKSFSAENALELDLEALGESLASKCAEDGGGVSEKVVSSGIGSDALQAVKEMFVP